MACLADLQAGAAPVQGTVQFPDEVRDGSAQRLGFWRVPNGVLPIAPPLSDIRAEAVVVLYPQGTVSGAQVAAQEELGKKGPPKADMRIAGLAFQPRVLVVPPGTTMILHNEDLRPHTVVCTTVPAAVPKQAMAPGGKLTFVLERPGEYLLRSQELAHMAGAILVVERGFYGRVERSGAFRFEAPEGHYVARLFWRGGFVASQVIDVAPAGAELSFKAPPMASHPLGNGYPQQPSRTPEPAPGPRPPPSP